MDKLALVEIIEHYLEGKLSPDDSVAFEKRMDENPELKQTVWEYQEIIKGINIRGENAFFDTLTRWESDIVEKSPSSSLSSKILPFRQVPQVKQRIFQKPAFIWAMAACIVLLIAIFLPKRDTSLNGQSLFSEHFEPYPDIFTVMGDTSLEQDTFLTAINAYNKEEYDKAADGFLAIIERYPDSLASHLYLGVSYIMLDQISEAQSTLTSLIQHPSSKYKEVAEYYLALTYLQLNDVEMARELLANISIQAGHDYQEEALNVLAQLN